ncbi:restriction endonuclease PLD domain-containing protein [Ohtaekwangia sp.]|uniref:restriction endonuclease PLD domain-containing protein n=1 Tax=Ohtaekwangia sp. TaxID=2066019 RepID=UPI002FDD2D34
MIIKKLAVPLVNDKILQQAEHVYIATAAISDAGFDFIRTRIPTKTKMDIVTGLDGLTSPGVLKRIWKHYQDRITVRIYTRNTFHANVYIFEQPFRKSVGFTGSGALTLEGLKDHEEVFNKVTDAKDIEALLSWYTTYYEFAEPLTEEMIREYDLLYPVMKQRDIISRQEKKLFIDLTTRGFNWDSIKFKTQFFKKEDYQALSPANASIDTAEIHTAREAARAKLKSLHEQLLPAVTRLKLHADAHTVVSSIALQDQPERRLKTISVSYGRSEGTLKRYDAAASPDNFLTLQVILQPRAVGVWLSMGKPHGSKEDRIYFRQRMQEEVYRKTFLSLLATLGSGYFIEVAGEQRAVESFQQPDILWEFTQADDWMHYRFIIAKNYIPGDPAIGNDTIVQTIEQEFTKLVPLYQHMKDTSRDQS